MSSRSITEGEFALAFVLFCFVCIMMLWEEIGVSVVLPGKEFQGHSWRRSYKRQGQDSLEWKVTAHSQRDGNQTSWRATTALGSLLNFLIFPWVWERPGFHSKYPFSFLNFPRFVPSHFVLLSWLLLRMPHSCAQFYQEYISERNSLVFSSHIPFPCQ